ncbi:MAG: hypothetical protein BWX60_01002 [Candidatus Marinimicrobia bacterium ADurb.Bin030]|nr:MAG: hypothetical protein BWX60_01002 [Candidatus Marinimicrobia bacterium ADurb.Bin030]
MTRTYGYDQIFIENKGAFTKSVTKALNPFLSMRGLGRSRKMDNLGVAIINQIFDCRFNGG